MKIALSGSAGTGKTTLVQALLRQIDEDLTVGLISNAQGDRGDLLRWVLNALNVSCDPRADYVTLFQIFQDFVIAEYAAGRHVVLIVDEAQNLGLETLEELVHENKEVFIAAGGEQYHYIPALNDDDMHIAAMVDLIEPHINK